MCVNQRFLLIPLFLLFFSCTEPQAEQATTNTEMKSPSFDVEPLQALNGKKYSIPVYDWTAMQKILSRKDPDVTYVYNFWATWCKPCIEELPEFESLAKKADGQKVQLLLISLDFPQSYESSLLPFVENNELISPVVALNEPDANKWIDAVDPKWQGGIPATIFIKGEKRFFKEGKFEEGQLEKELQSFQAGE